MTIDKLKKKNPVPTMKVIALILILWPVFLLTGAFFITFIVNFTFASAGSPEGIAEFIKILTNILTFMTGVLCIILGPISILIGFVLLFIQRKIR